MVRSSARRRPRSPPIDTWFATTQQRQVNGVEDGLTRPRLGQLACPFGPGARPDPPPVTTATLFSKRLGSVVKTGFASFPTAWGAPSTDIPVNW